MLIQNLRKEHRSTKLWVMIFILVFLTYAYCRQSTYNVNAITRTAMVVGLLDEGTARIDKYESITCDKAFYAGHYYSEKAPGLSLAAMPAMAAAYAILKAAGKADFGMDAATNQPTKAFKILTIIGTIFTSGLSAAAAVAALGWLCLRLGCTRGGAVFAALTFALATPTWGWATSFFGHAMAGSCCLLGFAIAVYVLETDMSRRKNFASWVLVGALLGLGVLVEYTLAAACIIIGVMILYKLKSDGKDKIALALLGMIVGIAPSAILFFGNNYWTFGSFFDTGYRYNVQVFPGMKQGLMGIGTPKPTALWGIIASARHGILWISPILALIPVAFWALFQHAKIRLYAITALLVAVYFIAMNAGYYYWTGGCSTGPRHLIPGLGFACFPLGFLWSASGGKTKAFLTSLFAVSFLTSMACAQVSMNIVPQYYSNPLFEKLLPDFLSGRIINIGQLCGIPGHLSLVPLVFLWGFGAWYISRLIRGQGACANVSGVPAWHYGLSRVDASRCLQ
jgi:hypothetical protein